MQFYQIEKKHLKFPSYVLSVFYSVLIIYYLKCANFSIFLC